MATFPPGDRIYPVLPGVIDHMMRNNLGYALVLELITAQTANAATNPPRKTVSDVRSALFKPASRVHRRSEREYLPRLSRYILLMALRSAPPADTTSSPLMPKNS